MQIESVPQLFQVRLALLPTKPFGTCSRDIESNRFPLKSLTREPTAGLKLEAGSWQFKIPKQLIEHFADGQELVIPCRFPEKPTHAKLRKLLPLSREI